MEDLKRLVIELCKNKDELSWLEFKHNNYDPQTIGESISALANGAVLSAKNCAYMLWGINDETHQIIGTDYNLQNLKKGNQELESWLRSLLSDNIDFSFETVSFTEGNVGVMTIQPPAGRPASFKKTEYIRVGSYTKNLKDHPELQERLWKIIQNERFEEQVAKQNLSLQDALALLGYSYYFDLTGTPIPTDLEGVAHYFIEEHFLIKQESGLYSSRK